MKINIIKIIKMPGMSMSGLSIEEDPNDVLGVVVRKGNITLANGIELFLSSDTLVKIMPDATKPMIAVISLTQKDGLVLNEWSIIADELYVPYKDSVFCDIAKFDIPAGCTSLADVEVTIPILE